MCVYLLDFQLHVCWSVQMFISTPIFFPQRGIMGLLISFHLSQCFHRGWIWEETRVPRFHGRSSRSVFNLLTVKLISHPITQQLTPNWLLSSSYGWVCTWIYCRCAKVHVPCDYVISKSIAVGAHKCARVCVRVF